MQKLPLSIHNATSATDGAYDFRVNVIVYDVTDRTSFTHATDQLFAQINDPATCLSPQLINSLNACTKFVFSRFASRLTSSTLRTEVILVANKSDLQRRRKLSTNGTIAYHRIVDIYCRGQNRVKNLQMSVYGDVGDTGPPYGLNVVRDSVECAHDA
jgi:hypothetical protein